MRDWPIEWFDEIDSTNEEARRRVLSGTIIDGWIAARSQTLGRGRLGRQWDSQFGNLFATALFRFAGTLPEASKIPFVTALSVADVFDTFTPDHKVNLKWPNDVRYAGAKVSGILIEAGPLEPGCWVAVGVGINVQIAPDNVGQRAESIASLRGNNIVTPDAVLVELKDRFADRMDQLHSGFGHIRQAWLKRAEGLGESVNVKRGSEDVTGVFESIGPDGELLLRLPGGDLTSITAGDVELVKERVI